MLQEGLACTLAIGLEERNFFFEGGELVRHMSVGDEAFIATAFSNGVICVFPAIVNGSVPARFEDLINARVRRLCAFAMNETMMRFAVVNEEGKIKVWEREPQEGYWAVVPTAMNGLSFGSDLEAVEYGFTFMSSDGRDCELWLDKKLLCAPKWSARVCV